MPATLSTAEMAQPCGEVGVRKPEEILPCGALIFVAMGSGLWEKNKEGIIVIGPKIVNT